MMKRFDGFPIKGRLTKIPALFFSELLPQIDNLTELRVVLYCFWRLQYKDHDAPYLWEEEIAADEVFMAGLAGEQRQQKAALRDGLTSAVARGVLLEAVVGKTKRLYFINTPRGRAMAEGATSGAWKPQDGPGALLSLGVERPNIFSLYEQNIGPLTPLIAEKLKDAEASYPPAWIAEAISIAVARNKRNLAYVEAILRRWTNEGRDDSSGVPADGSRFLSGKYRDEIKYKK
jgi:DNA replication protein